MRRTPAEGPPDGVVCDVTEPNGRESSGRHPIREQRERSESGKAVYDWLDLVLTDSLHLRNTLIK